MEQVDVAIIGSGFGGLGMGVALQKAGISSFIILEREERVGGTWRDNTYPGAECDVTSVLYSYSFHPHVWSKKFPAQAEILDYIEEVVDVFGLRPNLRFNKAVTNVTFDDKRQRWTVTSADGASIEARVVISSVGQLNKPAWPEIDGMGSFDGPAFHSAQWDHSVDLSGKRVGIIGTGASVIQFAPQVANIAATTTIFQRSAPYVLAKNNPMNSSFLKRLYGMVPQTQLYARAKTFVLGEFLGLGILGNKKVRERLTGLCLANMESIVTDEELRAKCTPDYEVGCKRVLFADEWFQALVKDNVALVTDPIKRITKSGITTEGGENFIFDALVFGTGFQATDFLQPMEITGRNGVSLNEQWGEGASAYRGVAVNGFPNLFFLYGPNTNLGSNSIIYMLESQANYIASLLKSANDAHLGSLEVRSGAQKSWDAMIDRYSGPTSWVSGCHSWYTTNGRNTNNWPRATWKYGQLMKDVDLLDYDVRPSTTLEEV